jgi:hypothetical protein
MLIEREVDFYFHQVGHITLGGTIMLSGDTGEIELGPEWDSELLSRLHSVVTAEGGTMMELPWGVGGSQEVCSYRIQLPTGVVEATAETYMGLVIRGPLTLVQRIAHAVKSPSS